MAGEGDAERLVVLLEAKINDFEKNLKKASGTATREFSSMRRSSATATRQMEADVVRSTSRINGALAASSARIGAFGKNFAAAAIAPVVGLLTLTAAINGTKAALAKFGDINDKAIAGGLDPEFFQAIAIQAKAVGVEFDTAAEAAATFLKLSGQAVEGRGKLVTQLKAEHPELLKSIQLATTQEERWRLIVDAIKNAKTQAEAAAIASAAFGDAGVKLVGAFRDVNDTIDDTIVKAKAAGSIVDRELVQRADDFGDKFDATAQIIDTQLKEALVRLGPVILGLENLVAEWLKDLNIVLDQFNAIEDRTQINPLQNKLVELENYLATNKDVYDQMSASITKGGTQGVQFLKQYNDALSEALRLQERIAQLQGKPKDNLIPKAPVGGAFTPGGWGSDAFTTPSPSTFDFRNVLDTADGLGKVASNAHEATVALGSTSDAVDQLRQQWEAAESLAQSFAQTFMGDLRQGKGVVESLTDAFGDLADQLLQMATEQAIKSLFSALMPGGGGTIAGGAAIPGGGFIPGLTGPKLFAGGGSVSGPGSGTSDSVPAMLSNGEFVVNAAGARRNRGVLGAINAGAVLRLARGGAIAAPGGEDGPEAQCKVTLVPCRL